jgi:uncharacterized peroxidase-related enzyme
MPHVHGPAPDEATGEAAEFYRRVGLTTGSEPTPYWRAQATRPDLASSLWPWFEALMLKDGQIGRALKEMIATRVSYANACRYCSAAHSGRAKKLGVPAEIVDRLADPVDTLPIKPRQRELLAFCDKARDASSTIGEEDWDRARASGWSDGELVEALHVVGMFSAFNRMADALGVEFAVPAPLEPVAAA